MTYARDLLPDGYLARSPVREDAAEVAALMAASDIADTGRADISVDELLSDWGTVDLADEAVAVIDAGGAIRAYADVLTRRYIDTTLYPYVDPAHRGRSLGRYLAAWVEEWVRAHLDRAPENARIMVKQFVNQLNQGAKRLVEAQGYEGVRTTYWMAIVLEEPLPEPLVPEGISIRRYLPEQDERRTFDALEDSFKDLWGRPPGTLERFHKIVTAEGFDPDLYYLAEDGAEVAGICLTSEASGNGWIATLGTNPRWRGRGLGLAMLHHAFGEFYRRGTRRVSLSVDAQSPTGAPRLYSRAGMEVEKTFTLCEKELRPGEDLSTYQGG
ncbi:MAG: GNAT family N-acetyltransferase [Dehalococcoidia bacterium]